MARHGCMVVRELVDKPLVCNCVAAVNERIQEVFRLYGVPFSGPQQLVTESWRFTSAPEGWVELGNEVFGMICTSGFIRDVGTGRIFTGTFLKNEHIIAAQER
jgi:hypothetical protein